MVPLPWTRSSYATLYGRGDDGECVDFLNEGRLIQLQSTTANPIGSYLPNVVELNVVYAEPAARGDYLERKRDQGA